MVEGGKGAVELQADGVIHLTWKPNVSIEAQDAHAAMAAVNEIAEGSEYPKLVEMVTVEAVSRQARAVFSVPSAAFRIASFGSGRVDRLLATFFFDVRVPVALPAISVPGPNP
ncbi:STAS/SEC14 domain-containing protein [Arthrobacter sp. NQ7]|uniref:DUF7793 family protein n=1 Tax=Arthrobacter sp. NQ7 TaxID=3032303 RepID=UPI00240F4D97|nr:STAS/SEC14 domain-containing protein [Arthrobacter sp. NQ7]MDJ0459660.1 STAS/SEC14 domain-containing protein [Arthrobacter sp. NQ7]